jgi:ABC-type multidrug transport system ATPase subunit
LPQPQGDSAAEGFRNWLRSQGVVPAAILPAANGDWSKICYDPDPQRKASDPGVYYWSQRYLYHYGIQAIKQRTDILRRHLPHAHIGANYSPHYPVEHSFLGETYKWVTCFRQDGMTLPWSEDYIFQVPVASPQINHINLDLFRAALRGKPDRKIMYYVMPHWPGNTPNTWRRLFYGALGHGMKIVNLFEFRPVQAAYTENHVSSNEMYATVLRSFRELGLFEDLVQRKQVISDVLELLDLTHKRDDYVNGLSRGMKQRLCLAKTLVHDPPVLILDEPSSGLDPRARIEVKALLKELRRMGKTILISSHILTELADCCTSIGIIERGQLLMHGPIDEVYRRIRGDRLVEVKFADGTDAGLSLIRSSPHVRNVQVNNSTVTLEMVTDDRGVAELLRQLVAQGVGIRSFAEKEPTLEDVFMLVTKGLVS